MAILYVNDGGSNTSPYDTWVKAANLMASALADAACVAGSTIYVQSDHVETYSADTTLGSASGVVGNPVTIISVTNTNEPPVSGDFQTMTASTGKLDAKTNGAFDIIIAGWDIWDGMKFIAGDNLAIGKDNVDIKLVNCKLIIDDLLILGVEWDAYSSKHIYFENVDVEQVTIGGFLIFASGFNWKGGSYSFTGGSTTSLFAPYSDRAGGWDIIEDVDIQSLDGGDYLVGDFSSGRDVLLKRCKIPAACNYMNNGPTYAGAKVRFHSIDDGNFIYKFKEYYFEGQIEDDIAVYRSATYDGTNEYSAKMIASKGNTIAWSRPLRFKLADLWCAANPTLTMHFNLDQAATIQNDELWFEIEYPDGTTGALGKLDQSSRPANILITAGDQGTSGGDPGGWTEAFANPQARSKAVTIAGGQAGIHTVWVCLAKEATVYVCPNIGVS